MHSYNQEYDAMEYMLILLDSLHEDLNNGLEAYKHCHDRGKDNITSLKVL